MTRAASTPPFDGQGAYPAAAGQEADVRSERDALVDEGTYESDCGPSEHTWGATRSPI